ncbi:MAG: LPS export ABC transporter periplasmic protein LptC [Deltaproteobacteria bacterium RBG_16_49_23]|nr:MAG: LPS export ABC transporter periplasmic protein LptC [Deltaproteobacteria bacterium RBG_16_49_23]
MKRLKIAILLSILLIGGIVLVSLWVNLQDRKKALEEAEKIPKISTEGADQRLEKIRFVEEKHGRKTWELEAKAISQYQGENILLLEDVKVIYYLKDGRSITISGNRGKVHQDSKNMELVGNVLLISTDGYRLKTESMSYQHSSKQAATSDPVEFEGEQIRLTGKGMLVDMEAKTFKVLSQARTQWKGGRKG